MPVALTVRLSGGKEVERMLDRLSPRKNPRPITRALVRAADRVQELATTEFIIRGSRFFGPSGPRGGRGRLVDAQVDPKRLTSRRGGSGLVGSIAVDRSLTPRAIDVGSDLIYAAVHELGSRTTRKRPFLAPALEKASAAFERFFAEEWQRELPR